MEEDIKIGLTCFTCGHKFSVSLYDGVPDAPFEATTSLRTTNRMCRCPRCNSLVFFDSKTRLQRPKSTLAEYSDNWRQNWTLAMAIIGIVVFLLVIISCSYAYSL